MSLAVLAGAGGLGAYGLNHFSDREPARIDNTPARGEKAAPMDLALAEVAAPEAAAPLPAPVQAALAPGEASPAVADRAVQKRIAKRKAAPVQVAAAVDDAAVAAAARERQQKDYEAAVARYDASEREEGFRWAKSNRVRTARYCRTTARRTDAFMEGCLSFVSGAAERGGARATSPTSGDTQRSDT